MCLTEWKMLNTLPTLTCTAHTKTSQHPKSLILNPKRLTRAISNKFKQWKAQRVFRRRKKQYRAQGIFISVLKIILASISRSIRLWKMHFCHLQIKLIPNYCLEKIKATPSSKWMQFHCSIRTHLAKINCKIKMHPK